MPKSFSLNIYKKFEKIMVTKKSILKSDLEHYALSDECIVFFKSKTFF